MIAVNLIPEHLQIARARGRHLKRWSLAATATALALAGPITLDWLRSARVSEMQLQANRLHANVDAVRRELKTLTAEVNESQQLVERAGALRSKRAWSGVIGLISACMPDDCWLTSIATDPAAPAASTVRAVRPAAKDAIPEKEATVVIDAPRKLRISGYAVDAAQPHAFVANLKDARIFTNVSLERSQREAALDGSYFRFELSCEW